MKNHFLMSRNNKGGGFTMLHGLKLKYKGKQVIFSGQELISFIIKIMQDEKSNIEKSRQIRPPLSAFNPSEYNILRTPSSWLKVAFSLQQSKEKTELGTKIGYRIGGRHIVFFNPSDRYAIDYGKYKNANQLLMEWVAKDESIKKIVDRKDPNECMLVMMQVVLGFITINIADEHLVRSGKTLDFKPSEDALLNELKEEDQDRIGYTFFYRKIHEFYKEKNILVDDIAIAKQMRALLGGEQLLSLVDCTAIPELTAALFMAEVSRNPTCFLSGLILLDFIESGITYGANKLYTWKKILWDPEVIEGKIRGQNILTGKLKQIANLKGGKHPMTHHDSYLREFKDNMWNFNKSLFDSEKDLLPSDYKYLQRRDLPLSTARKRESSLLIRWLYHRLNIKISRKNFLEISDLSVLKQINEKDEISPDAKEEILVSYIKPLILERLRTFDLLLGSSNLPYDMRHETKISYDEEESLDSAESPEPENPKDEVQVSVVPNPNVNPDRKIYELGVEAYQKQRFIEANKLFIQLTEKQPTNPAAWNYLGQTFMELGEYEKAIKAFESAKDKSKTKKGKATEYETNLKNAKELLQEKSKNEIKKGEDINKNNINPSVNNEYTSSQLISTLGVTASSKERENKIIEDVKKESLIDEQANDDQLNEGIDRSLQPK